MGYFFNTERLSVGYKGAAIVENIDFELKKGQILTLIGPNGSGKSTILKTITKQIKADSGAVYIEGHALDNINRREFSRKVSAVLTERPEAELMTCRDVVAAGRYPYTGMLGILSESDRKHIEDALATVGAAELANRNFSELSDGQLQRVMLARAICQEPELIALDEPTSFLDIRCAVEILDLLRSMADSRGITVLMSLHELNYAKRISDIVICVKNGRVLYLDTPDVIFTEEIIGNLYDLPKGYYGQLFGGL